MNPYEIDTRRRRYFELNSALSQIESERLRAIFDGAEASTGWGQNHVLDVGEHKVFAKRVPLTDLEVEHEFSTKNLYSLPTYYNYGVGSAGFGAFRELLANIKATNWVLEGQIETIPILYHYRILPRKAAEHGMDTEQHEGYIRYWGGSENIGSYIQDRASATHELVLFLEYVPEVLQAWFKENSASVPAMLEQLKETFDFLTKKGVIHFDAHFQNILTDGSRPYVTDFGLVLDKSFDLSKEETEFFEAHPNYDFGEALSCLSYLVDSAYDSLSESDKKGLMTALAIDSAATDWERTRFLVDNLDLIIRQDLLPLDGGCLRYMSKYRKVIVKMRDFYFELRGNDRKDTPFPSKEIAALLAQT